MAHKLLPTLLLPILLLLASSTPTIAQAIPQKSPNQEIPDALTTFGGRKVKGTSKWENKRRQEILAYYAEQVYGQRPVIHVTRTCRVMRTDTLMIEGTQAIHKEIILTFKPMQLGQKNQKNQKNQKKFTHTPSSSNPLTPDSLNAYLTLFQPLLFPNPRIFIGLNFYGNHTISTDTTILLTTSYIPNNKSIHINSNHANDASRGTRAYRWPLAILLKNGYGLVSAYCGDFAPDVADGYKLGGIQRLIQSDTVQTNHTSHSPNTWGTIDAWAWGLSEITTYLKETYTQPKVIAIGHSRLGKAALWAGATDSRIDMVVSNNSGCAGAALFRRDVGEDIAQITASFPYWFTHKFSAYAHKEDSLRVDQHMLLALMAPRPVYVASAAEDNWADPEGEFLSLRHALPVYQLYHPELTFPDQSPAINKPVYNACIGYHIREGKHELTSYDWEQFILFADRCFQDR